jgi:hypothetical protein
MVARLRQYGGQIAVPEIDGREADFAGLRRRAGAHFIGWMAGWSSSTTAVSCRPSNRQARVSEPAPSMTG